MLDEQKSTMPLGMLKLNVWFFFLVKLLTGRLGFYSSVHTHNGLPNSQISLVFRCVLEDKIFNQRHQVPRS